MDEYGNLLNKSMDSLLNYGVVEKKGKKYTIVYEQGIEVFGHIILFTNQEIIANVTNFIKPENQY